MKTTVVKKAFLFAVLGIVAFAGAQIPSRLMWAKSGSVKYKLFYYRQNFNRSEVRQGRYVTFDLYDELYGCKPCLLVKRIGCDEGQYLEIKESGSIYCSGQYLGFAKKQDSKGNNLPTFRYKGLVPAGQIFAIGESPNSYDSRYYGFIKKSEVKGIALPIF